MSTEKLQQRPSISFWLLERTGGAFLSIAVVLAGSVSFLISAVSLLAVDLNAQFSLDQFTKTALVEFAAIFVGLALLIIIMRFLTPNLRERLGRWAEGKPLPGGKAEQDARQEITSIFWRYAIGISISFTIVTLAVNWYQYSENVRASSEQIIYTFLGSVVSIITTILIASPILERILKPVHKILLLEVVGEKLGGARASGFQAKFQAITFGIITIGILLMAPLGYHVATLALSKNINGGPLFDGNQLLRDIQIELVFFSVVLLAIGLCLPYIVSQQIFGSLRDLLETINQVEKGNLKQRANITSSDEIGQLATSFNRMITQLESSQQGLEKRIANRTEQLRASNEVGKIASTILDPDALVAQTVNLIANTFSYYFVAIFLISDDRWAELKDATGTAGEVLKENRHRVLIGDNNLVGAAIVKKEAQIALDTGEGAKILYNPLLPYTRSELALPLVVGDRVIGAVDVQSQREADFTSDDISTLQGMTNQVAIAIENARLFKEMDETLEELRQANRQYVVTSWSQKLKGEKLEFSTKTLASANGAEVQEVEVGLNLRDQNIGYIRLHTDNEWNQEDQSWVESLATQVAVSLENARLLEASQESALRERLSASIVQKIWASNSIDSILQTAVRELGRALEASEATIELKIDEN
jgi:GAF domain-containing protein/HAMP domain-containing protein